MRQGGLWDVVGIGDVCHILHAKTMDGQGPMHDRQRLPCHPPSHEMVFTFHALDGHIGHTAVLVLVKRIMKIPFQGFLHPGRSMQGHGPLLNVIERPDIVHAGEVILVLVGVHY